MGLDLSTYRDRLREIKPRLDATALAIKVNEEAFHAENALLSTRGYKVSAIESGIGRLERASELCAICLRERTKVKTDVEELATLMLQALFDDSYRFELEPVVEEEIVTGLKPLIYHHEIPDDPRNYGGGVRNVVSFAIRILFVLLKADLSPILLLDEPFVNLDRAKWDRLVSFLQSLIEDIELQVILVTHSGAEFPQTFVVTRPSKVSIVQELPS